MARPCGRWLSEVIVASREWSVHDTDGNRTSIIFFEARTTTAVDWKIPEAAAPG
jgi:hypothetical protein